MPRPISPALALVHNRAPNPQSYLHVELSAPDVGQVLRRPDQWTAPVTASPTVSAFDTDERGALTLASVPGRLASTMGPTGDYAAGWDGGEWNIDVQNPALRLKGVGFELDKRFAGCRLKKVRARLTRDIVENGFYSNAPLLLQIYKATAQLGVVRTSVPGTEVVDGRTVAVNVRNFTKWSFTPLLSQPAELHGAARGFGSGSVATPEWDLTNYDVRLDQTAIPQTAAGAAYELSEYFFQIQPAWDDGRNGIWHWRYHHGGANDNVTADVGRFHTVWWVRDSERDEWRKTTSPDDRESPLIELIVDTYPTAAQATYAIDLGRTPAAGTTGRVVIERAEPAGTSVVTQISTSGGAYLPTHNQDAPTPAQTYGLYVNLVPSADGLRAPRVSALGVEFRTPYDASPESTVTLPAREVAVPTLVPAIADASLNVIRTGRRDYADLPSRLASTYSPAVIEADVYLASRNPLVTRGDWLRLERLAVSTRDGDGVSETYGLLSIQRQLKRKVPRRTETIRQVLTVAAGADKQVVPINTGVSGNLSSTLPLSGSYTVGQYAGQGYYVEVRSSATLPAGAIYTVDDNEGTGILRFGNQVPFLPAVPAAGDVLVLHSGRKALAPIRWVDTDPADIQLELITLHAEIPRERVGSNDVRNGGLPPSIVQRSPADTERRKALKVTRQIDSETEVAALLNSLSYLTGGAWLDVAGQLCFVQLYPLRDASGAVVVPLGPSVATFGPQDLTSLQTPSGLSARQTEVSVDYGVNTAAASPDATPTQTVSFVDADALAFHTHQDLEDAGTAKVADDVSKWLFNSADAGLALAVEAARMPVLATSTGARVWPFTTREARYDLLVGDVVTLVTDQVTDYDPATKAAILGFTAFTGVLVKAQGGRSFALFVQGLPGNAVRVTGGPAAITGGASAAIAVPTDVVLTLNRLTTESGGNPSFAVTFTRPPSPFFDHMKYRVERRRTGDSAWLPTVIVPGERAANDVIPAEWDADYRVTPVTVSSGGTEVVGTPLAVQATGASPAATLMVTSVVREATAIVLTYTYNAAFSFAEVWVKETASDPGAPVSVERTGSRLTTDINRDARFTTLRLAVTSGNWLAITLVPANALNVRNAAGVVNLVRQSDTGATAPSAPTSAAPVSHNATQIINTVTPSVAGSIRPYLAGSPYGADVAGAVAGTPQSITHGGLTPATAYAFEYASVNASGVESTTRTAAGSVTTDAGGTLATPTIHASAYDPTPNGYYVFVDNIGSFPSGTLFTLDTLAGESDTASPVFRSRADFLPVGGGTSETISVTASHSGYTSATSSGVTVAVP